MRERGGHVNGTAKLTLGDTDVTRIGLGTNRLAHTPENMAFVRRGSRCRNQPHRHRPYVHRRRERGDDRRRALPPVPDGVVVATKGGYRPGEGRPEVLAARDRSEPSAFTHRNHRALLLAPGRSRDPARGEPRRDQGIPRQWDDPARRPLGGGHRPDRTSTSPRPGHGGSEPVQPLRTALRRRRGLLRRPRGSCSSRSSPCAETAGAYSPRSPNDTRRRRHRSPSRGCSVVREAMLPIPGTLSLEHARENLAALELELTDEEFESLR